MHTGGAEDDKVVEMRRSMNRLSTLLVAVAECSGWPPPRSPARRRRRNSTCSADFGAGGQVSTQTFSGSSAFTVFNEAALVATNQNTSAGSSFDANGGYRIGRNVSIGVGV